MEVDTSHSLKHSEILLGSHPSKETFGLDFLRELKVLKEKETFVKLNEIEINKTSIESMKQEKRFYEAKIDNLKWWFLENKRELLTKFVRKLHVSDALIMTEMKIDDVEDKCKDMGILKYKYDKTLRELKELYNKL